MLAKARAVTGSFGVVKGLSSTGVIIKTPDSLNAVVETNMHGNLIIRVPHRYMSN